LEKVDVTQEEYLFSSSRKNTLPNSDLEEHYRLFRLVRVEFV